MGTARNTPDDTLVTIPPPIAIAGCLAATGFAIALISGLFAGRAASAILEDAVIALAACHVVGYIVGRAALVAIDERAEQHISGKPLPDLRAGSASNAESAPRPNEQGDVAHSS